jgi:hypothetical protein
VLRWRERGEELIDRPGIDPRLVERSHAFMRHVNRLFGGTRLVRRFVAEEAARAGGRLRVLDLGSGTCDIPVAVARWARRRGLAVRFRCVEADPHAAELARAQVARAPAGTVELVRGDLRDYEPEEPFDCAVGSMVFHHLDDGAVVGVVRRLRRFVRRCVLVNDLARGWAAYAGARLWTLCVPGGVRHDALLSVRRGFRVGELRALLAGIEEAEVAVRPAWLFRVRAVVRFRGGGVS